MFLSLDPISLHTCRQVNRHWNLFIQNEVWGKPEGRREMEKKILNRFKLATPKVVKLKLFPAIFCCQMDERSLAVGCNNGNLIIVNPKSIQDESVNVVQRIGCSHTSVNFDMNEKLIVTGSSRGKMAVWNRGAFDAKQIYESTPPESQSQGFIAGVKIVGDTIVTATSDRIVSIHSYQNGEVRQENVLGLAIGSINHIDADQDHVLFATADGLRMVDMEKGRGLKLTETNLDAGNFIHHCALFYPHAGYSPSDGGFKIANMETGKVLRHLHNGVTIGVVAINKRILAVQDPSLNWDIFIYERKQLIDATIKDKDLWSKRIHVGDKSSNDYNDYSYFLAVNETSIVHFSKSESRIVIQDFWLGDLAPEVKSNPKNSKVEKN